jgi:MscS family membrane protein
MATVNIETLSVRDKFWFRHVVGLSYATTVAQMRDVSRDLETLLVRHPGVDATSVRVRFFRMGPYSLDVELFAYVFSADWELFLGVQQELLLRVMEIVGAAGTEIAFPSQTLHLSDGRRPTSFPP